MPFGRPFKKQKKQLLLHKGDVVPRGALELQPQVFVHLLLENDRLVEAVRLPEMDQHLTVCLVELEIDNIAWGPAGDRQDRIAGFDAGFRSQRTGPHSRDHPARWRFRHAGTSSRMRASTSSTE